MITIKWYIYDTRYESIHPVDIKLELEYAFGKIKFNCSLITNHSSKAELVVKVDVNTKEIDEKILAYMKKLVRNSRVFVDNVEYKLR